MGIISGVSYPVLCKLQNDKESLCAAYSRLIRVTAFLLFPLMVFLSFYGKQVMIALFGMQWADAGIYMTVLCIPWMTVPIQCLNLNLLQVVGRSDLLLKLEIIGKTIGFTVLIIALPVSVLAVCIGYTVTAYLCFFVNTYYTSKFIDYSLYKQIIDVLKPLLISAVVVGLTLLLSLYLCNVYIQLVVGFILAVVLYITISYMLRMEELFFVVNLIKEKLKIKNNVA